MSWLLGVDGGGSKTAVRVAQLTDSGELRVRGSGSGGPSNIRAVGAEEALANLDRAIDVALAAAGRAGEPCDVAVLALAGSALPDVAEQLRVWADKRQLAAHTSVVHDADAVLAMLPPASSGVALILGTGSAAIGHDATGQRIVVGGWGHLLGDFGSAFDLGRRGLVALTAAVDGTGPGTSLVQGLLAALDTEEPREIVQRLGSAGEARQRMASLAPEVLNAAASGDSVAARIVDECATAAAELVLAAVRKLDSSQTPALALAGGVVCKNRRYREALLAKLSAAGQSFKTIVVVDEPVEGSLRLARRQLANS